MFGINKLQHCEDVIFIKKKKKTIRLLPACTHVIINQFITVAKQASPIS